MAAADTTRKPYSSAAVAWLVAAAVALIFSVQMLALERRPGLVKKNWRLYGRMWMFEAGLLSLLIGLAVLLRSKPRPEPAAIGAVVGELRRW